MVNLENSYAATLLVSQLLVIIGPSLTGQIVQIFVALFR